MQSTSKFSLLISVIVALYLFSVVWAMFNFEEHPKPKTLLKVEMHERIVEREKIKRSVLIKYLNHLDTIYLDTFQSSSQGLKQAIELHRTLDTTL
jgi:hypothetical protein